MKKFMVWSFIVFTVIYGATWVVERFVLGHTGPEVEMLFVRMCISFLTVDLVNRRWGRT